MKLALDPPLNYEEVGLIVGLEVHQQLLTAKKMFCNCPAGHYTTTHDGTVLRHMRPTLSELGEYDGTALMEFKTKKNIIYLLNQENTCTYEMDDTPPFLVNQDALDVAIEQCLMLGCDIIDEVHIARKQYLDGSIPTGFQRTAIVGVGGKIPFRDREISITQISVEEDSCREVSDQGHLIVWRTDRLGMPLIETVTGPDMHHPDEVAEAILLIGRVCRSTGHVRTGPGASRQDVNVSVRGGRRVEIKGVPYAWLAPRLVHCEAWRQVNLLKLRDELHQRGFDDAEKIQVRHQDITEQMEDAGYRIFREEIWKRHVEEKSLRVGFELGRGKFTVRAVKLAGLAGILDWPTQPDHTFADELRGRLRVICGLDQQPILIHGEKWPDYDGSQQDVRRLKKLMGVKRDDAVIVVWGPEDDTLSAVQEIKLRLADAIDGIPNETRQPLPDGSTDFERILPGPDRMYPDTDSPPTRITRNRVTALRDALPPPPWEREQRYAAVGIPTATIHYLIRRGGADIVDKVVAESGADLRRVCFFFGERLLGLRRRGINVDAISPAQWVEFFRITTEQPLLWEDWLHLVSAVADSNGQSVAEVIEGLNATRPDDWRDVLSEVIEIGYSTYAGDTPERRLRHHLGVALEILRGRVSVAEVRDELARLLPE